MKTLKYSIFATILIFPCISRAQQYSSLFETSSITGNGDISSMLNGIYVAAISAAAIFAVLKIILAGVKYMLSDLVPTKEQAKQDIKTALLGLIIIISAVLILETINPRLTNFDIKFVKPAGGELSTQAGSSRPDYCRAGGSYTEFRTIPHEINASCREKVDRGWVNLGDSCCPDSTTDTICCGFDENQVGRNYANFGFKFFVEDAANSCKLREWFQEGFETIEACQAAQSAAENRTGLVLVENCEGEDIPSAERTRIAALPTCEEGQSEQQTQFRIEFIGTDGVCYGYDRETYSSMDACLAGEEQINNMDRYYLTQKCDGTDTNDPNEERLRELPRC